jgi:hypothetical protein
MPSLPELSDGIALTHFIVAADVERSARFYSPTGRWGRSRGAGSGSSSVGHRR